MTHYMLAHSVNGCRFNYLARTTLGDACREVANAFDESVLQTEEAAFRQMWYPAQMRQATFSTRDGGRGLDAAYVVSRAATQALYDAVRPVHRWAQEGTGGPPCRIIRR